MSVSGNSEPLSSPGNNTIVYEYFKIYVRYFKLQPSRVNIKVEKGNEVQICHKIGGKGWLYFFFFCNLKVQTAWIRFVLNWKQRLPDSLAASLEFWQPVALAQMPAGLMNSINALQQQLTFRAASTRPRSAAVYPSKHECIPSGKACPEIPGRLRAVIRNSMT
jgi:hypothetical protein